MKIGKAINIEDISTLTTLTMTLGSEVLSLWQLKILACLRSEVNHFYMSIIIYRRGTDLTLVTLCDMEFIVQL